MGFYVCVSDSLLTWRHPASTKSLFFMLSVVTLASCFFNASTLFFMAGQSSTALRDSSVLFCDTQLISGYLCPGRSVIHSCKCKVTLLPGRSVIHSCQCKVTLLPARSVINSSVCKVTLLPARSFINSSLCKVTLLPARSVINSSVCKVTLLPSRSVINSSVRKVTLLPTRSVINSCVYGHPSSCQVSHKQLSM